MTLKKLGGPLPGLLLACCMMLMLVYPASTLAAALRGLAIWWDVLFPSLFPFFVISEMLLGFGVVHLFGALLDPLMRPLFNIPGSGGFVAAMGYVSGYPVGAKLTAKLREQQLVSRAEGERLVAFTTSSDPIFLLGAVSVGFFHDASLGLVLALAHYGGGLIVGLLMSFHGRGDKYADPQPAEAATAQPASLQPAKGRLRLALSSMAEARRRDGRSFGELLKSSIQSSLQLIIVVGGLVVFFNVLMELLTRAGVMTALFSILGSVLSLAGFPQQLSAALASGFFEVTIGARSAGEAASSIPLQFKAAAAAFILSWGGLSVHAQVASILNGTGLRYLPFMAARLVHGLLAAVLLLLLWKPVAGSGLSAGFSTLPAASGFTGSPGSAFAASLALLGLLLGAALLLSLIIWLLKQFTRRLRQP
ncbi:membrane protein [Paenibacillus sp. FSL R7-0273]|uniref:sporulation integral membrane protein YlbJ n=1 Tax=Paenibacillus sp. FSL R7-0273 TaxID=1536772 RepID=UPI0004F606A6|nr:sporulation integral membrane protein YlbJ [Paenibacillus sp. FSL R7-0273]AIQ49218.1 membrane protein [Paenibacillus sp. FSL R7-0273]OMF87761.1 sporulation integral membrane protein YlbJ [Paenibacillus sp. FSL R7-0273]